MTNKEKFVGLFPAGGLAKRLGISGSKEIVPVLNETGEWQAVGQFLLDSYQTADIQTVYIILRQEKKDIHAAFGNGEALGLNIRYLNLERFWGTPYTVDQAWPMIQNNNIAFGFPDIILEPKNTFLLLKKRLLESTADVVLGLFPTNRSEKSDMVEFDDEGIIKHLQIKPTRTNLTHTWATAVWRPSFSLFMHEYLASQQPVFESDPDFAEPFIGTVINAALVENLSVTGLIIPQGRMLDIGTPGDLKIATSSGFFANTRD